MRKSKIFGKPLPLNEWQMVQRAKARKRTRIWRWIIGIGVGTTLLAATIAFPLRPLLIWNASASTPIGLYYIGSAPFLKRGDLVAVWLPEPMRGLAAERRYLPRNIPALKRIVAVQGDRVCAIGRRIFVNGESVAERLIVDSKGRPMPLWEGCRALGLGDLFLLNSGARNSFDGRYIGVTKTSDVLGKATSLCPG
ncbi:MAG: conjugative transfer signal peptidase TraF [Parasphingorhabdus sp.]|jgi:conjugative transfer signal peptidase TraF|uniref:S26 family signal peptidase n=1 Tax=Parasphingorhabdus sp. TaxID=2709688 RepID=UPI0039E28E05